MDFIENNQRALLRCEVMLGVGEPRKVGGRLEIQVNRGPSARSRDRLGESGFTGLARTEEHHSGELPQQRLDLRLRRPCNQRASANRVIPPRDGRFTML